MVRTQIYLTEQEQRKLRGMSEATGRTQSELIRAAIDRFLAAEDPAERRAKLLAGKAIWQGRTDLPDPAALRRSWDRL